MLIYRKLLLLPSSNVAGSSAVTLMGNDVETLSEQLHFLLVESWANSITVALSIWMLSEQLGAVCVAPVLPVLMYHARTLSSVRRKPQKAVAP